MITSSASDDVALAVFEAGNRAGPPILFVHGFSQSYESWDRQWHDPLPLRDFHLVAYDLRFAPWARHVPGRLGVRGQLVDCGGKARDMDH